MSNEKPRILLVLALTANVICSLGCKAKPPSRVEKKTVQEGKELVIGGKNWQNPLPDDATTLKRGASLFQLHCQVCHGLDGHATGVPFAKNVSPPVPDLGATEIQKYSDGQLKWIVENGIRLTGMPSWKGLLKEEEMWQIVRHIRHLPRVGSVGIPKVFVDESEHAHKPAAAKRRSRSTEDNALRMPH